MRPIAIRESFVDDHNALTLKIVEARELAALRQRHLHGPEIIGRDNGHRRFHRFVGLRNVAFWFHARRAWRKARLAARQGHRLDAG